MAEQFGIGSKVWLFDVNSRAYTDPAPGKHWGDLIYRSHFREYEVVGGTRAHWHVGLKGDMSPVVVCKISKKADGHGPDARETSFNGRWVQVYLTHQAMMDDVWVNDNRQKVIEAVTSCKDAETLRKIQALLNDYLLDPRSVSAGEG